MQLFVDTKIDFLRWRFHALAFSLLIVAIGAVMFFTRGVNLGVDFAGGAELILRFQEDVPVERLRSIVADATIQQYGPAEEHTVMLRLPQQATEGDYAGQAVSRLDREFNAQQEGRIDLNLQGRDRIASLLMDADPSKLGTGPDAQAAYTRVAANIIEKRSELGIFRSMDQVASAEGVNTAIAQTIQQGAYMGQFNVLNQETVGPQVGAELQRKAILAILLSTLAMGIYIAVRFDLKFGVAAIVCLLHDVAVALAFLLIINGEFEILTVASFLMIIGYSINDTVVVYDRVRENMRKHAKGSFYDMMNLALNQTLSRTILTGGSVILVLLSLILFGGEVINEFAWLLLIGIIAGTYSTMTIVPAVAVAWAGRGESRKAVSPGSTASSAETRSRRARA